MWQPIETCPKDGTEFDVWAKRWIASDDKFIYRRFADSTWLTRQQAGKPGVVIDDGWRPTHWMPIPDGPRT